MAENNIQFDAAQQTMEGVAAAAVRTTEKVNTLSAALRNAFKIGGMKDYCLTAQKYGKTLTDQLLVMQLRMGQMKSAIVDAVMPLASVFVPIINQGSLVLIRFLHIFGQVAAALLQGPDAWNKLAKATGNAEKSQKKYQKTGRAAQRSLARFDQIERLNRSTGGGGGTVSMDANGTGRNLSQQALEIRDDIMRILQPLTEIDFLPVRESFGHLKEALEQFLQGAGAQLEWLWFQVLVPLAKWTIEEAAPLAVQTLTSALQLLQNILGPVAEGIRGILEALQPVAEFMGGYVLELLETFHTFLQSLGQTAQEKQGAIQDAFLSLHEILMQVWSAAEPVLMEIKELFLASFQDILTAFSTAISGITDLMTGLVTFLSQVFSGDFAGAWNTLKETVSGFLQTIGSMIWEGFSNPIEHVLQMLGNFASRLGISFGSVKNVLKGAVNGIIGMLNGMISGVTSGVNAAIRALNAIHVSVPDWVPGLGGRRFGFSLNPVQAPRIPYLAQGAVLPANRPFMAVVGDQKNGTNVEAPLETIKQAVAEVMGNGMAESVAVQKSILEAVLGIEIGDEMICGAVDRFRRKRNIMTGGGLA